jgi:hypothetical protein
VVPSNAYLEIRLSDTTYTTQVLPYLPCYYEFFAFRDTCGQNMFQTYHYYYYNRFGTDTCWSSFALDTLYTRPLQTGDTVRFAFQAEFYNPAGRIDPPSSEDSIWLVAMWTPRPEGCATPHSPSESATLTFSYPDTLVKFRRPVSLNVYPYYPAIRNDTVTVGSTKRFVDVEVRAELADSALRDYPVFVESPVLVDSGGHSHDGTRPLGRYRVPKATGTGFDTVSTSFVRKTDSTGVLKFKFLASQFGGVERIKARLVSDSTRFDTLSLITRVPGLVELGEGEHYILVGAPDDVDPCPHNVISLHYRNHFGTNALLQAIEKIAARYDSLNPGIILRINDMSLEKGGVFDIENNWIPDSGHTEHRVGQNADIGYKGINQATQCVDLELEVLRRAIYKHTTGPTLEHKGSRPHFHIRHLRD